MKVLSPCGDMIGLKCFDPDSGAPELIDLNSKLMGEIFSVAAALFKEGDVELKPAASALTMKG
jgi:hypothetical protein